MSIVPEWELICSRQIYLTLPDTLYMIGNVIGSFVGAPLTDLYGRRKNLIGNMVGMTVSMLLCLVPGGVMVFASVRIFQGYFSAAAYNAVYCSFVEHIPKAKRAMIVPLLGLIFLYDIKN